ncbi:4'-phosphopantetheinyl transferase [Streptomyces sp. NPDC051569]|uniref:4'-phosphopantetheinyl transferase n=1 Tax=Streptomyces sp. NPDC051569 TaxID=3365661 RepID=UPI0037AFB6AF
MIDGILPAAVAAEVAYGDPVAGPDDELFPQEKELIAFSVPKRQREFTTVRFLARRAMRRLGLPPVPVLSTPRGAPRWPDGVVGSMTHCDGYRAAVVASSDGTAALGIDAEPDKPLPRGVLDVIALPSEATRVAFLTSHHAGVHWDRLLFCAKESVFKVWHPLTGRELDFSQAEITIDPLERTFHARLLVPGPVVDGRRVGDFAGRWHAADGLMATAIHLPAVSASVSASATGPGPGGRV